MNTNARTAAVERAEKSPLSDLGSELLLGREKEEKKKCEDNGWTDKKQNNTAKMGQARPAFCSSTRVIYRNASETAYEWLSPRPRAAG